MQLNSVDLPAPFGPISAVIEPASTSRATRRRRRARRRTRARRRGPRAARSFEHHLVALAEDALRPEEHEPDDHEPDHDQPHVGAVGASRGTRTAGSRRSACRRRGSRTPARRPAPPRHGRARRGCTIIQAKKVSSGCEVVGAEERELPGVEAPGDAGEGRAERERLELVGEARSCPSEAAASSSSRIARSTRPQGVRTASQTSASSTTATVQTITSIATSFDATCEPSPEPRAWKRSHCPLYCAAAPTLPSADRPLRAAREAVLVRRDVADDLAEGDRDDREVVGAQPQRREPEQHAGERRGDDPSGAASHMLQPSFTTRIAIV